jgi:retron-type reverse transcriptase
MFKRRRETRHGGQSTPQRRPVADSIAGSRVNCFNRKIYKLTEEHKAKVEVEVKKTLEAMKLKAAHNSIAPRRTGGIPLTSNTLHSYEKHFDSLYFFSVTFKTMKVF